MLVSMDSAADGDPAGAVRAAARAAIAEGNQAGALALLRLLFDQGPEAAAGLTPTVAEALVATARAEADTPDQAARDAYRQAQVARAKICELLAAAPLDLDDLAQIRLVLSDREQQLRSHAEKRLQDQVGPGNQVNTRRLGNGWIERYWVESRWGTVPQSTLAGRRTHADAVHRQGRRNQLTSSATRFQRGIG